MMMNHGWDPEKEAKIREHLKRLQGEKMQRKKRFEEDLKRLEEKRKSLDKSAVANQPDR